MSGSASNSENGFITVQQSVFPYPPPPYCGPACLGNRTLTVPDNDNDLPGLVDQLCRLVADDTNIRVGINISILMVSYSKDLGIMIDYFSKQHTQVDAAVANKAITRVLCPIMGPVHHT